MAIPKYRRILLKLSGEALAGEGSTFDPKVLDRLAGEGHAAAKAPVQILSSVLKDEIRHGDNAKELIAKYF